MLAVPYQLATAVRRCPELEVTVTALELVALKAGLVETRGVLTPALPSG